MSRIESYKVKSFEVVDPDARLREADDLMTFRRDPETNAFLKLSVGLSVRVTKVEVRSRGGGLPMIFAECVGVETGETIGWTSVGNFRGKFINETLGMITPRNSDSKGPNAMWENGRYLGQANLVRIVDASRDVEFITEQTAAPYLAMVDAAAADGVAVLLNSGFRSYPEQKYLHDGWVRRLPGFNPANRPGRSNHQNGVAFDIPVSGGAGSPVYDWLAARAPQFGFIRTVAREPWHWEYLPHEAAKAVSRGLHEKYRLDDA